MRPAPGRLPVVEAPADQRRIGALQHGFRTVEFDMFGILLLRLIILLFIGPVREPEFALG